MNENNQAENVDAGEPISRLADLEQEVSPRFLSAVRNKIYRRTAANQVILFSWNLPKVIFLELLMLVGHFFNTASEEKKA